MSISRRSSILILLLLMFFTQYHKLAFAEIYFSSGIIFSPKDSGKIFFDKDFKASRLTFSDNMIIFNDFSFDSTKWKTIGFFCEPSTANLTICEMSNQKLCYVINASTWTQSKTKIFVGTKGKPKSIEGCSSWGFNVANKIITVNVIHQSPAEVEIEWAEFDAKEFVSQDVIPSFVMLSGIYILIVFTLIIGAIYGNIDHKAIAGLFGMSIILPILLWCLTMVIESI